MVKKKSSDRENMNHNLTNLCCLFVCLIVVVFLLLFFCFCFVFLCVFFWGEVCVVKFLWVIVHCKETHKNKQ